MSRGEIIMGVIALLLILLAVVLFGIAAAVPALTSRLVAAGLCALALSLALSGGANLDINAK